MIRPLPKQPDIRALSELVANHSGLVAAAHRALRVAIRRGDVLKPTRCESCQREPPSVELGGHHEDYRRPLEVMWLCVYCHAAKHNGPSTTPLVAALLNARRVLIKARALERKTKANNSEAGRLVRVLREIS